VHIITQSGTSNVIGPKKAVPVNILLFQKNPEDGVSGFLSVVLKRILKSLPTSRRPFYNSAHFPRHWSRRLCSERITRF